MIHLINFILSWNGIIVLPFINKKIYKRILTFMISLAFGTMTSNSLLKYIPLVRQLKFYLNYIKKLYLNFFYRLMVNLKFVLLLMTKIMATFSTITVINQLFSPDVSRKSSADFRSLPIAIFLEISPGIYGYFRYFFPGDLSRLTYTISDYNFFSEIVKSS